ncbi:MAG TPA: hypothetical protein G4O09_07130 [Dehalococcoidia bacterium]|nr:hypothetical protein [Dehalococcoidia bacterium]
MQRKSAIGLIVIWGFLAFILISLGCAAAATFDRNLRAIVAPHVFSITRWEMGILPYEVKEAVSGNHSEIIDDEVALVTRYFSLTERIGALDSRLEAAGSASGPDQVSLENELAFLEKQRAELTPSVERVIARQVREALKQQGIYSPLSGAEVSFPPLNFTLQEPPRLLVVSPRDHIESIREVTLKQDISLAEIEAVEAKVDSLGVSSLVVRLGGLSTFPTFVSDNGSLSFVIDAVVEEWLHQYLAFTPLGFRYVLDATGVSRDYEIATMNETVAGMVSDEIGAMVYDRYYGGNGDGAGDEESEEFDREMREIRRTVDEYLARGEAAAAEQFMEERRQYLAGKGYYLRKLNQAYFAFYGTYADSPTSISPIGLELKKLREQSASVKDFLGRAATLTSREDLKLSIE